MVTALSKFRPRSLRARFAIAFGLLLALATLNVGAFYWGALQRNRDFRALRGAIARHGALNEIRAEIENEYKRVKVVSDLLGVEQASVGNAEYNRVSATVQALHDKLTVLTSSGEGAEPEHDGHAALVRLSDRLRRLTTSWTTFYAARSIDPGAALAEVVVTAEPLAQELLGEALPEAIEAEHAHMEQASDAFVRTDRVSSRLIWAILLASGLLSIALAYSLSRQLLGAIVSLKAGAERFGSGELAHRVSVDNVNELAEVGDSLNTMALRLRYAREELEVRNLELANLAFKDPLTQLANRTVFRQRVELALGAEGREPDEIAVLFIDVDNFKSVNDTFGHESGDRLLVDVANRLLGATRGVDTVARLGGDEFAILLDHVHVGKQAKLVAERVIGVLGAPFSVEGNIVHVTASIGVAWGREGEGAEELLRNADVAMYRAKARGKGRYEVFAPEMHAALLDRAQLESELRWAVEREQLSIAYQPVLNLATEQIIGFEALARWNHPVRGAVSPATFIPLAEDTGIILALGRWILQRACTEAADWSRSLGDGRDLSVSVNVSSRQLEHPSFTADVKHALEISRLPAHCLVLEITESAIMRESAVILLRLNHLKDLGVKLAIDDFGTGYSSLAYLRRFPVDLIKIDKAFVDGIVKGASDTALVKAIITLSQALGLATVAEGIELGKQHAVLRELGCQLGQGYLFSRPLIPSDARKLLHAREEDQRGEVQEMCA